MALEDVVRGKTPVGGNDVGTDPLQKDPLRIGHRAPMKTPHLLLPVWASWRGGKGGEGGQDLCAVCHAC